MPAVQSPPSTTILTPHDRDWDDARKVWNLTVDQHPAAIALPESPPDVVAAVRHARERGLRVAAQATGHGAAPLGALDDTLLVKTSRMRRVTIDPVARTAWAEAGVTWLEAAEAAARHDLAGLAGSAPGVGVVGYTLGGGVGWLGRSYGLSANNVQTIEVVTADGRLVRADACHEADLFWALRGGGGSFGVVTAIELRLFPVTEAYAGLLRWPADAAPRVLEAWRELTRSGLPDEFTTSAQLTRFPAVPEVSERLRGKSFVIVTAVHLDTVAEANRLLAPLRELSPDIDTMAVRPAKALSHLKTGPEHPVPSVSDGLLLASLPAAAIGELITAFRADTGQPSAETELIHIGGEMARARPGNGALAAIDAEYAMFAGGLAPSPAIASAVAAAVAATQAAMSPWAARQAYLNFADTRRDPAGFWTPQAYDRLRRVKAAVDPDDVIRANHPIPRKEP